MSTAYRRVAMVLHRIENLCKEGDEWVEEFQEVLDKMLDEMHNNDGFGTEGSVDPRGDFRNGTWSMWHVEGIDEADWHNEDEEIDEDDY